MTTPPPAMTRLHQADIDMIERDSAVPGLRCVLDPQRLREALPGEVFAGLPGDIRVDYVRYRPHRDCIGRYTISLGGRQHLAYAKAFGPDAASRLAKAAGRAGVDGPHGAGRLAAPEHALLFAWFPNDRKMRSLERLGEVQAREQLTRRLFKDDETWRGSSYQVLNYRPEKRLVCRLEQPAGRAAALKFYTPATFGRTLQLLRSRAFSEHLPVPQRIGGSKRHCVHAFEWLPGHSLREASVDPAGDTVQHQRCGSLLAELHAGSPGALALADVRATVTAAASIADQLTHILPAAGKEAAGCARRLGSFVEASQRNECPVHADFYDKQIIAGPTQLALIDLDQARMGSSGEDLGCFIAHLELLGHVDPQVDEKRVKALSRKLLDGYLEGGGRYQERELAGWTALSLFFLSGHPFRDRMPDWPDRVREILHKTRSLLTAAGLPG